MSVSSISLPLGAFAPSFNLKATDGKNYSLEQFASASALVIFFSCNHCPYVTGSDEVTRQIANKYKDKNAVFIAINSNCDQQYPEDSYSHMVERMQQFHFPWLYLRDETQSAAHAYGAIKTPHFFVFNDKKELIYSGRAVDAPRYPEKITTHELEDVLESYFHQRSITTSPTEPIGCSIKWKKEPKPTENLDFCDI